MKNINIDIKNIDTHINNRLSIELINPADEGKTPAPLYISQNQKNPEFRNKLILTIRNASDKKIVVEKMIQQSSSSFFLKKISDLDINLFNKTLGEYAINETEAPKSEENVSWCFAIDFSDFTTPEQVSKINIEVKAFGKNKLPLTNEDFTAIHLSKLEPYPGTLWGIQYTNEKDDFQLDQDTSLEIHISNLAVTQRPSLRYLDVHWRNQSSMQALGLFQESIVLKRPPHYVRAPFPLTTYWMDDHNIIYISKKGKDRVLEESFDPDTQETSIIVKSEKELALEIENELRFAISNIGLDSLKLDCRQDVRESPYFELIILGNGSNDSDSPGFLTHKNYISPIQLEIDEDGYGNKWTHHKMIQGPVATWRIEPKMYVDGKRNTTIMGTGEHGNISFKLSQIRTYGIEGISMIYLKYYNIPDHDDNQMVLFVQKKLVSGSIPSAGIQVKYRDFEQEEGKKEYITAPIRWEINPIEIEDESDVDKKEIINETILLLGDKVGIGLKNPSVPLHIDGETTISALGEVDEKGRRIFTKNAILKMIGAKKGDPGHIRRPVQIQGAPDDTDNNPSSTGSKMLFITKDGRSGSSAERMVINSKGNVGIGNSNPEEKIHIKYGNFRIDSGEIQSWGPLTFHPDVDKSGDDIIKFLNSDGAENVRIHSNGNVGIGNPNPDAKLDVYGITKTNGLHISANLGNKPVRPKINAYNKGESIPPYEITGAPSDKSRDHGFLRLRAGGGTNLSSASFLELSGYTNGKPDMHKNIVFGTSGKEQMRIESNGNVGIGTSNPKRAKLVVDGSVSYKNGKYAHYAYRKDKGAFTGTHLGSKDNTSIYASKRIVASEFNAVSDGRIKNLLGRSDSVIDLQILNDIKVVNYKYIDFIQKGEMTYKKTVAQQLKKVYPEAVNQSSDFIPNIYKFSTTVKNENGNTVIGIESTKDLSVGDIVRLHSKNNTKSEVKIISLSHNTFKVQGLDPKEFDQDIFVYGKEVNDFLMVDYDAISMLNVSATQELYRRQKKLKKENKKLSQIVNCDKLRIKTLEQEVTNLKQAFTEMQKEMVAMKEAMGVGLNGVKS